MENDKFPHDKLNEEQMKLWKPTSHVVKTHRIIIILSLVYWLFLIFKYYRALMETHSVESIKSLKGFLPYFTVIVIYPILFYIKQLVHTVKSSKISILSSLSPLFPICFESQTSLTTEELDMGAVGKVDYKCLKKQTAYVTSITNMVINSSYYLIYGMFALTLFLFATDAGSFRNKITSRNSVFMKKLIQQALFLSLILMSSALFTEYYFLSTIFMYLYKNILQMVGATLSLVVCFILYRLIYLFT